MKLNKILLAILSISVAGIAIAQEPEQPRRKNSITFGNQEGVKTLKDITASIYPVTGIIGVKTTFSTAKTALFYIDNSDGKNTVEYDVEIKKELPDGTFEKTEDVKVFPSKILVEAGNKYPVKALLKVEREEVQKVYRIYFNFKKLNKIIINSETGEKKEATLEMPITISIPIYVHPTVDMIEKTFVEKKGDKWFFVNEGNIAYKGNRVIADGKEISMSYTVLPKTTREMEYLGGKGFKKVELLPNAALNSLKEKLEKKGK